MKSDKNLFGKLDRRVTITLILVLIVAVITVVACIAVFASEKQHKDSLSAQTEAAMQQGQGTTNTADAETQETADTTADTSENTTADEPDNNPEPDDSALTDSGAEDESDSDTASDSDTVSDADASGAAVADDTQSTDTTSTADTNIIFTGDVMLSPYVLKNYDKGGIDSVVEPTLKDKLTSADILEINEEFPFGTGGKKEADKQYNFRVDPKYVSVFTDMGVDVAGLANNHTLDYGKECLNSTFDTLNGANIPYTGAANSLDEAKKPAVIEKNGKTFAFIAASRVLPRTSWDVRNSQPAIFSAYDTTEVINAIKDAKSQYDYVFVIIHWGIEKTTKLTNYQQKMGHSFIDAGADAVIGSHPHVLQGVEYYNGKPVFYSLGNFIFNQTIKETAALNLTVSADGSLTYTMMPAKAVNGTTQLESEEETAKTLESLRKISPGVNIDDSGVITAGE